jgi:hypothetical protein
MVFFLDAGMPAGGTQCLKLISDAQSSMSKTLSQTPNCFPEISEIGSTSRSG